MPHEPSTDRERARPLAVRTGDGLDLEAVLETPATPCAVAVVAHPHPRYGGDMANPVVTTVAAALGGLGAATVRFNFRGVGASDGVPGDGNAERDDLHAVLEAAARAVPHRPLVACGYSFGADVALAVDHPAVVAWLAVAPVLRLFGPADYVAAADSRPTRLLVAEHDHVAPPPGIAAATAAWRDVQIRTIPNVDHFMHGGHERIAAVVREVGAPLLGG